MVRDRLFLPQVLFICGSRGGGRGVEASKNGKPEENGGDGSGNIKLEVKMAKITLIKIVQNCQNGKKCSTF